MSQSLSSRITSSIQTCEKHLNYPLKTFCIICKKPLCSRCLAFHGCYLDIKKFSEVTSAEELNFITDKTIMQIDRDKHEVVLHDFIRKVSLKMCCPENAFASKCSNFIIINTKRGLRALFVRNMRIIINDKEEQKCGLYQYNFDRNNMEAKNELLFELESNDRRWNITLFSLSNIIYLTNRIFVYKCNLNKIANKKLLKIPEIQINYKESKCQSFVFANRYLIKIFEKISKNNRPKYKTRFLYMLDILDEEAGWKFIENVNSIAHYPFKACIANGGINSVYLINDNFGITEFFINNDEKPSRQVEIKNDEKKNYFRYFDSFKGNAVSCKGKVYFTPKGSDSKIMFFSYIDKSIGADYWTYSHHIKTIY